MTSRLLGRRVILLGPLLFAILAASTTSAHAQRGTSFVTQQAEDEPTSPANRGFVGWFDTEVLRKGHVSADLPFGSIDVGLTDNLNIGTYLLYALPSLSGNPSGIIKARYLLHRNPKLSVVAHGFLGFISVTDEELNEKTDLFYYWLGSNVQYLLSEKHAIGGTLALFRSVGTFTEDDFPTHTSLSTAIFGLRHQYNYSRKFAIETNLLLAPWARADASNVGASVNANLSGGIANIPDRFVLRSFAHIRTSNKWLFQVGGVLIRLGDDLIPLPWLTVGRYW